MLQNSTPTTSLPTQRFERKVRKIPILPPHLSHIPIEICSESITFRLKPSLKSRIQRKADANKVSMTKILLWMADKHLGSSFTDEDEEKWSSPSHKSRSKRSSRSWGLRQPSPNPSKSQFTTESSVQRSPYQNQNPFQNSVLVDMWLRWKSKIIPKGGQPPHPPLPVPTSQVATFSISMPVLGCDPATQAPESVFKKPLSRFWHFRPKFTPSPKIFKCIQENTWLFEYIHVVSWSWRRSKLPWF